MKESIIFAVIYLHPKIDFKNLTDFLSNILMKLENKKQKYVVSSDININQIGINKFLG